MTDFIYTTTDYGHVPQHRCPDTYEPGRVCCRCHFTILSIYNPDEACWQCGEKFRREAADAERRRQEIEERIGRLPRERVTA